MTWMVVSYSAHVEQTHLDTIFNLIRRKIVNEMPKRRESTHAKVTMKVNFASIGETDLHYTLSSPSK